MSKIIIKTIQYIIKLLQPSISINKLTKLVDSGIITKKEARDIIRRKK